jgi:predicted type IV restriction endonuclease
VPVVGGDFADYVLRLSGQPALVLEAKKLGSPLGEKEAAQVVKYASVLGVRWGIVTDGQYIKVFDPRVPHVSPENRLVFEVDLAGYRDPRRLRRAHLPGTCTLIEERDAGRRDS